LKELNSCSLFVSVPYIGSHNWNGRQCDTLLALCTFAVALLTVWLDVSRTSAHDLLDAEEADRYLQRIDELNAAIIKGDSVEHRAEALFAFGETIAHITVSLNRDLVSHNGELGLVATVLVNEFRRRGIDLSWWPEALRYRSYLRPFEQYVALLPHGAKRAEALFRILQGRFYDSFISDPLQPVTVPWSDLVAEIEHAKALLAHHPTYQNREEVLFILAVDYVRASWQAPDAALRHAYVTQARATLQAFHTTYPNSLRTAAAHMLLERLPTAK
jgi:hypothetical protein